MVQFTTDRLHIRQPSRDDIEAILGFERRNKEFLQPYEPLRPESYFTRAHWQTLLERRAESQSAPSDLKLYMFPISNDSRAIGMIGISGIIRGAFHACYLGFAADEDEQGKGYMTEALKACIAFVFDELRLHRIMANHMPSNAASSAVLKKLGFVREGVAENYLLINGRWEDHVLTSLTNPNWSAPPDTELP